MRDQLASALQLHQAGRLEEAARLYEQILKQRPLTIDALHLFGVLCHQRGEHARAVQLISRAIAMRPNVAEFHANLAEAYRALGQLQRAAESCRVALRLSPNFPEALCNLGLALQGLGKHAEAVEEFRRALTIEPNLAPAHSNLATALRELGQHDEAIEHYRQAIAIAPDYAPAHTNLGQMLLERGQLDEALRHGQQAVQLAPELAAAHHNLGTVLEALGRTDEARARYAEAVRLDPKLARSHARLGRLLRDAGDLGSALTHLQRAVELEPGERQFWEDLAELHIEREDPPGALAAWRRVLVLAPDHAAAHNGLGWALQEMGRLADAEQHYRTALRLEPSFGGPRLALASMQEEMGDLAASEATLREAIHESPTYALAHARLATLLRGKLADSDLAALEARLADPELADGPRARLLFGLAHVMDGRGEWSRAAEAARQANALTLAIGQRRKRSYDPTEHAHFVDRVLQICSADWFTRLAGAGIATRRPVFIIGLPRSGSTLIEQVLASHSQVFGGGELRLSRYSLDTVPAVLGRRDPALECLPFLTPTALQRVGREHEAQLRLLTPRAERIIDKMLDNYLYLGLLAAMFPEATWIHCRRDLRDVAVSCWLSDFRILRWANDIGHITTRMHQYRRLMQHWHEVLPGRLCEVHYEDTVANLEQEARRLVVACGLEWEPACLEFHRTPRRVRTASITQVRQPVYTQSVARWKHYERELADLFAGLPSDPEAG
jgi:tetratricopeptide (TPR) repeat protein